jgi:hypothetical protein
MGFDHDYDKELVGILSERYKDVKFDIGRNGFLYANSMSTQVSWKSAVDDFKKAYINKKVQSWLHDNMKLMDAYFYNETNSEQQ